MFVRHNSRDYIVFCGERAWLTMKHYISRRFRVLNGTFMCTDTVYKGSTKLSQNVGNSGINIPELISAKW